MKIINTEIVSVAGGEKKNEDSFFTTKTKFGVFDGASSLNGYVDEDGNTGAYLASSITKKIFEHSESDLVTSAKEANDNIKSSMVKKGIDVSQKVNLWGTTMAVVDVDINTNVFRWVQVADALIFCIYKDGTYKMLIEGEYNHDRSVIRLWKKLADKKTPNIREKLQGDIVELRNKSNVSYGVLNGEQGFIDFLQEGVESLDNVANILICTDGMTIPNENPDAEDDFKTLIKLFLESGLQGVYDYIRIIENSDPDCLRYPRYKKSDDFTAIAVTFD